MVTATIVVFLALFGGAAVLGLMIWLISRNTRGGSAHGNFVGGSSQNQHNRGIVHYDSGDTDVVDHSYYTNESATAEQTASDAPANSKTYESASSRTDYSAPPADYGYSDSSSYDSGSSGYDSGGSSDSGSSSSSSD
jgi:hypothetical protein